MIDLDLKEGLGSINAKNFPKYYIYLNGKEYEMSEVEALFLSGTFLNLIENDENINMVNLNIKKEDVFDGYDIEEEEFGNILVNSFDRIINTVHKIFAKDSDFNLNMIQIDDKDISLDELCCIKVILGAIDSRSLKVRESIFEDVGEESAIKILNVIGNRKSIEYVGKHLKNVEIGKIAPGRLEEVLRSEYVQVNSESDILRVVEESIKERGWGAGFLLGCVEARFLSRKDRKRYVDLISQYISTIGNDDNNSRSENIKQYKRYDKEYDERRREKRRWNGKVQIDCEIIESLLNCVGENGEEDLKQSEPLTQCDIPHMKILTIENLNQYFHGRIKMLAKPAGHYFISPESVLIPGDDKFYYSIGDAAYRDQWIMFNFPTEVCVKKLDIRPDGGNFNPRKLNIYALVNGKREPIAVATFPNEERKTYTIETEKDIITKFIKIQMDGSNYSESENQYALCLREVTIYGYQFE